MKKITIYGLPLNPLSALEQLKGGSFCVSYATREKLGRQLDDAICLVGDDGMLLVDNGAFSLKKRGISTLDPGYVEGFEAWARGILNCCPQAVAVIPDVIDGTVEQNAELVRTSRLNPDRCMAIWHLDEPFEFLTYLCESFDHVGFGSAGAFWKPGTPAWHARVRQAFAAIAKWEVESGNIRPRLHMMRAQAEAHKYPFDSSDSTNVAVNHNRQRKISGETLSGFARRIDARIQASAGPEAEHQIKRPLYEPALRELLEWFTGNYEIVPAQGRLALAV